MATGVDDKSTPARVGTDFTLELTQVPGSAPTPARPAGPSGERAAASLTYEAGDLVAGLPTTAPALAPARAPPYWQSRVLRRKAQAQDHQLVLDLTT